MKQKITCPKCANKYIDCRDLVFCNLKANSTNGFGYLYRGKEGYKETPGWCPLQETSLKIMK